MEEDKKNVIKLIGIMVIYILLSALGVFGQIGTVLFPIVALPFTLFCIRNKVAMNLHVIFHVTIAIIVYLMMHTVLGILIYIVSVVIPAYIILYLYKQEIPLPNLIMYGGLLLAVVAFVYFAVMKRVGFDFEAQYSAMIDLIGSEYSKVLDNMALANTTAGNNVQEMQQIVAETKEMFNSSIEAFKVYYPSVIVTQVVLSFSALVILVNSIARRKIKSLPSIKQLFQFRVSKVAVVLLVLSMGLVDVDSSSSATILVLGLNLMSFLATLFQIVGVFSLITLIKRTSASALLKVLGYISIIVVFFAVPYMLMFFGCLDALFNYRKVSIVV